MVQLWKGNPLLNGKCLAGEFSPKSLRFSEPLQNCVFSLHRHSALFLKSKNFVSVTTSGHSALKPRNLPLQWPMQLQMVYSWKYFHFFSSIYITWWHTIQHTTSLAHLYPWLNPHVAANDPPHLKEISHKLNILLVRWKRKINDKKIILDQVTVIASSLTMCWHFLFKCSW